MNDLDTLVARAKEFARTTNSPFHSGHLLWSMVTGKGVATSTLRLRQLSEGDVRRALRELGSPDEPEPVRERLFAHAATMAAMVRSPAPSPVHLLFAIASAPECIAHRILADAGIDVSGIRNQALRNMTSALTREHAAAQQMSLPVAAVEDRGRGGSSPAPRRSRRAVAPSAPDATGEPTSSSPSPRAKIRAWKASSDVGRQIEQQVQQRMRRSRGAGAQQRDRGAPAALNPRDFPELCALGRDLSADPEAGAHIVGRDGLMEQVVDILNKKEGNTPLLLGPTGVGKTSLVRGVAARTAAGTLVGACFDKVVEISAAALLSGAAMRGDLCERLGAVQAEIARSSVRVLLFFDDVDALFASHEFQEGVTWIKEALASRKIAAIFAADSERGAAWRQDPVIARLVTPVLVPEPEDDDAVSMVAAQVAVYARHHGVQYDEEAARWAVRLTKRYVPDGVLPHKAVALLDLVGAQVRRRGGERVSLDAVADAVAAHIGVPSERLTASDAQRLLRLEEELGADIVGHDHVLRAIAEILRRNAAGFRSGRPIGSFLFLGPTGVGKTETAKSLARHLFADERALLRFDMSEFSEPHAVARLVGAPPGYVGHEEGGQLTEAVRRRPYSLVLFDEIEKAHQDVVQLLLQVLDDGRLTDGLGRTVDFSNTVIIMTSNLGSDLRRTAKSAVGFGAPARHDGPRFDPDAVIAAARSALSPELWNRIDEPLVFAPLTRDQVAAIARLLLSKVGAVLAKERGVHMEVDEDIVSLLVDAGGFDAQLGARPMRRTIAKMVEGPVAKLVLSGVDAGSRIRVFRSGEEVSCRAEPPASAEVGS